MKLVVWLYLHIMCEAIVCVYPWVVCDVFMYDVCELGGFMCLWFADVYRILEIECSFVVCLV